MKHTTELSPGVAGSLQADIVFGVRPVNANIRSELLIR
jgi:hypothetical protein